MTEYELTKDLNQITAEINSYKQIAGQSIWEIGRRLNFVKQNDLVHGEFMAWIESLGIEYTFAKRSMKIANEFSNSATVPNLSNTALYLITTLPEEEKQKQIQKAADGDSPTVRELRKLRQELKEKDESIHRLKKQPPEVKEVIKEIKPHDYEGLKSDNEQLSGALRKVREELDAHKSRKEFIEKQYNELLQSREAVEKDSKEYNELKAAIERMQGKMNKEQQKIAAYSNVAESVKKGNELLDHIAGLVYVDDLVLLKDSDRVNEEVTKLVRRVEKWTTDMNKTLNQANIIEGEIIHE
ncbi:hypothetical protein BKP56_09100 [Marinilactibacillus sp. 15R]|uniref:DUF3102 domain-containing protein n=1 Tax=Marinilactibacillus sp. 15R TaxID=1911586 RepID=UPI00090A9B77|nr:DUF3102 domain-containing protein [Marinilactibacillus sp. 15R]API89400.1 hypothetical protein BKP56_09100 [Marinilactibacillus sp. 15R]